MAYLNALDRNSNDKNHESGIETIAFGNTDSTAFKLIKEIKIKIVERQAIIRENKNPRNDILSAASSKIMVTRL